MPNLKIQDAINAAAEELANAFNNKKAANEALKDLKRSLKEKLMDIPEYQELVNKEKELKNSRKGLTEELKEMKKSKEQIALETDEQKELDDFVDDQEVKFGEVKDRVVCKLSQDLADEGVTAEVLYKTGQLTLIVARA